MYEELENGIRIPLLSLSGEIQGYQTRINGSSPRFSAGVHSKECQPYYIPGKNPFRDMILVCEGPTDAIAAGLLSNFDWNIVGCWSSGTMPPRQWWSQNIGSAYGRVVVAGDGDPAGRGGFTKNGQAVRGFNQRIADEVGLAYECKIPDGIDVRKILESPSGDPLFRKLIDESLARKPLIRDVSRFTKRENNSNRSFANTDSPDLIIRLVESAGGVKSAKLSDTCIKYYCPLHVDRQDASLTVNPITGSFHCWTGCASGGPLQFVMAWKSLDRKSAAAWLKSIK